MLRWQLQRPVHGQLPLRRQLPRPAMRLRLPRRRTLLWRAELRRNQAVPATTTKKDLFSLGPGDNESVPHDPAFAGQSGKKSKPSPACKVLKTPMIASATAATLASTKVSISVPKFRICSPRLPVRLPRHRRPELSGDANTGDTDSFLQQFATAGLFHRQAEGLNFGAVSGIF